jgi:hypothetical protein
VGLLRARDGQNPAAEVGAVVAPRVERAGEASLAPHLLELVEVEEVVARVLQAARPAAGSREPDRRVLQTVEVEEEPLADGTLFESPDAVRAAALRENHLLADLQTAFVDPLDAHGG